MAADGSDQRTILGSLDFDLESLDLGLEEGLEVFTIRLAEEVPSGRRTGRCWRLSSVLELKGLQDRRILSVLYTVGAGGDGLTPLFVAGSVDDFIGRGVAWSPDGRQLAFMYYDTATEERRLYSIGRDGLGLRILAETPGPDNPRQIPGFLGERNAELSWSPNGDELLFGNWSTVDQRQLVTTPGIWCRQSGRLRIFQSRRRSIPVQEPGRLPNSGNRTFRRPSHHHCPGRFGRPGTGVQIHRRQPEGGKAREPEMFPVDLLVTEYTGGMGRP